VATINYRMNCITFNLQAGSPTSTVDLHNYCLGTGYGEHRTLKLPYSLLSISATIKATGNCNISIQTSSDNITWDVLVPTITTYQQYSQLGIPISRYLRCVGTGGSGNDTATILVYLQ